jgi:HrpA-like RNA helicase
VVVTAPTGAGKSTQVPRWAARHGRVLVIEPRRVACRGLAARVAVLEGTALGDGVGYVVRDDNRAHRDTRIVFATPGVVLRWLANGPLDGFQTVVLDEFHERSLDVDLLFALLFKQLPARLAVMSATLKARKIAQHLDGEHLHAEGRAFPVDVQHLPGNAFLPDPRGLEERIGQALERSADVPGDVLVFLPGKGEIASAANALRGRRDIDLLPLHGGLSLEEQSRVFQPARRRRVILSTNVAETSLTIPGVGVVIDSGLARRTRYHNGRGFLALVPIANDSADQRAGRAGRTAPGVCFRLWSPEAILSEATPPEIHREALDPLVLAAAACGEPMEVLPFLDPPRDYAVEAARANLVALGALDGEARITPRGRKLFGLPLDAPLGNLLVEAERSGCLEDALDLVSILAVGRLLFSGRPESGAPRDDLRADGCDAVAFIRALREGHPARHGLNAATLQEARAIRRQLGEAWGLSRSSAGAKIDRKRLALTALAADPRCAYIARRRKRSAAWSNGGTEVNLARESAVDEPEAEALVVLETRALGTGQRKKSILITCAMPVPIPWLLAAGIGQEEVSATAIKSSTLVSRIETSYAGRVLASREDVPQGVLARRAVGRLFLGGRLFPGVRDATEDRLSAAALFSRLRGAGRVPLGADQEWEDIWPKDCAIPPLEDWVHGRLEELGLESGNDLPLLTPEDLLAPDLPPGARDWLDKTFPRTIDLGDVTYEVDYDLRAKTATLNKVAGRRNEPPSLTFLPSLSGFDIRVQHHSRVWQLR